MSKLSIAITAASAVLSGLIAYPVGKQVYAQRYASSYCQTAGDPSRYGGDSVQCSMDPGPQYYAQGGYITTPTGLPVAARPYVMQVKTKRVVAKKPPLPRPRPKYPTVNRAPKDNSKPIIDRVE